MATQSILASGGEWPHLDGRRPRIMLVTSSRIAYRGLLGRVGPRKFGAWVFYLALQEPFKISISGGPQRSERIALVPPYRSHQVSTQDHEIATILVEAETVCHSEVEAFSQFEAFISTPARQQELMARMQKAFEQKLERPEDFDQQFFGVKLPARVLDARIRQTLIKLNSAESDKVTLSECAADAKLSFSRFSHLFCKETQVTFRGLRAWKRARRLLFMVADDPSLVNVALDAGYADSTHFSHAIREFYGCSPRGIFAGSRQLKVICQWPSNTAAV